MCCCREGADTSDLVMPLAICPAVAMIVVARNRAASSIAGLIVKPGRFCVLSPPNKVDWGAARLCGLFTCEVDGLLVYRPSNGATG